MIPVGAPASFEERWDDWRDVWLEAIHKEVIQLHLRRKIRYEFLALLAAHETDAGRQPDTIFAATFNRMYVDSTVMAIRRQADSNPRTLSLYCLLKQLKQYCEQFTREAYVERWLRKLGLDLNSDNDRIRDEATYHLQQANHSFDQFTDNPGASHLEDSGLATDQKELRKKTKKIKTYANKQVAHHDRIPPNEIPTYGEVDAAIDCLGELLQKYNLLLDQSQLFEVTPYIQGDWKAPFRRPLVT